MWLCDSWKEYQILDLAGGDKLEEWNGVRVVRPDPQVIWEKRSFPKLWASADGVYHRSRSGGGSWEFRTSLPERWPLTFEPLNLTFHIKPTGFKHMGLFPEQGVNWEWMHKLIKDSHRPARVLNLFAYTGGATLAAAAAGAQVVHVDSSKGVVTWAKENLTLSGMADRPVRFIADDAIKFVEREIRRGNHYEGIIMDPPSYGRGPGGEVFKLEKELHNLIERCALLLSDEPLFFLINSYTTGLAPSVLSNLLHLTVQKKRGGKVSADEVGLPVAGSKLVLPCGASGRWQVK
ncbi:MAG: class I SAM-dependent methyltransferase [Clostridia bacterium]|nr:class I SAM-dependent methyltransferase [Clostridia bacterium]